jgi:hypothetical protein
MADKKTNYSFKDKGAPKTKVQQDKEKARKTATQKIAEKTKSKSPSLGTGMAEKARKDLKNRPKKIEKALKKAGA